MKKIVSFVLTLTLLFSLIGCSQKSKSLNDLQQSYPQYFNLSTGKGLEVYVWKLKNTHYCGILDGTNRQKTTEEFEKLKSNGVSIDEMKMILSSYDIPKENIFINPIDISNPYQLQSDEYIEELKSLFDE